MPGFDGTGPLGKGQKTGRGLGNCTLDRAIPRETTKCSRNLKTFRRQRSFGLRRNRRGE